MARSVMLAEWLTSDRSNVMIHRSLIIAGIAITALSPAMAIDVIPEQDGWSGFVLGGVGYTDLESNEVAGHNVIDVGQETIDSINDSPPDRMTIFM